MKKFCLSMILFAACTNSAFAINYCECGLYAGAQAGWAIIKSPTRNGLQLEGFRGEEITSCRGSFAWGINGGYNYPIYPDFLIGFESGYHDNGSSSFTFSNKNEYKIESTDWELLATGTWIFFPGFWFNVKWGVARIKQVNRIWHISIQDVDPTIVSKTWQPTTTLSLGYNFCNFDLYFTYRYVFGRNQNALSNAFDVRKEEETFPGTLQMRDKSAWIHAIYVGLQASIY